MNVCLIYFKDNGKFYTQAGFTSERKHAWEVFADVHEMWVAGRLPGIVADSRFLTLVQIEGAPPHFIGVPVVDKIDHDRQVVEFVEQLDKLLVDALGVSNTKHVQIFRDRSRLVDLLRKLLHDNTYEAHKHAAHSLRDQLDTFKRSLIY